MFPSSYPPVVVKLLDWFSQNGRDLPWRHTKDPYAVWLSEIILQQTRVAQGEAYWRRFMERWPNVELLAAASEDEVLREWQGLGYYSRARNLRKAAQMIVEWGHWPQKAVEWQRLPGVGTYTSAAIASMVYGEPVAVVDGNVYRVLARCFAIHDPIDTTFGKRLFQTLAQKLLPAPYAGLYNQAIMDFGATVCTPKNAQCVTCPLMECCAAFRANEVDSLPVKERRVVVEHVNLQYVYIRVNGYTAMRRRGEGDIWQGLWEPWLVENQPLPLGVQLLSKDVKHMLTHRSLHCDFYFWQPDHRPPLPKGYQWIKETELYQYAVPRLIEKLQETVRAFLVSSE